MATVDSLDIQISAQVNKANASLTTLINRLDRVSASLAGVNSRGLATMGAGINKLANAMSNFSANTKTADFSRLSRNLASISNIDTSKFSDISSKMSQLSSAFNSFGAVPEAAQQIGEFARNISKLGNKGITNAITNIPQLSVAMRNLMQTLSTAPVVSQNVIQMTNALANLVSQGGKVGTASRTMVSGLNNTSNAMNRAKRSSLGLAAAFGKFYATWFLAIRGIKGFMKSVESTTDYIEAYNYYNVAFGKVASEWDKDFEKYGYQNAESYAESFTKRMNETLGKLSGVQVNLETGLLEETGLRNLGLNIQEITQYASQLASVTNSIGQTGEVSLAAAKSMTMLAGDISSLFNVDYGSVAQNLNSALIGQSRAVYRFGIDITNATLQTYAYNLGLEKSVSDMTQAEKMQLRMIAILDQSKVSWGDLANTISSPSNMLRQFANNVKELSMVFGQLFIPVLQKVMPIINGVTIALKRLMVAFANFLGIKIDFDAFGQGYSDLGDDIDDVSDSLDGVAKSAKKANAGLRAFDELKVINMPNTSASGGGVGGGNAIDLTDEILKATEEYERVWNEAFANMENTAQEWADKIEKYLEPVKKIFKDFAIGDFFQAGKDTSALVAGILNFFADAIDRVNWFKIGKNIGNFLAGLDWFSILKSVGHVIWEAFKAVLEAYAGAFASAPFEVTLISLATVPSILKKITSAKYITGFKKLGKVAKDSLWAIEAGFKDKDIGTGLSIAIENIRENLSGVQKAAIGVIGVWAEFSLVKSGFYDLTSGADNFVVSLGKIAAGAGVAVGALKLIGLSNPWTALIVGATGLVGAIMGIDKAQQDAFENLVKSKEIEVFGENLEEISQKILSISQETEDWLSENKKYLEDAGIAEAQYTKDLADRYFDLYENKNRTNEQTQEAQRLAQELMNQLPSLQGYYDAETGLINTTREAVENLIEQRLKEIKMSAAEDRLKEAYQKRLDQLGALELATENMELALQEMNAEQEKFNLISEQIRAYAQWEELGKQIWNGADATGELKEKQKELYDFIMQGRTEFPTIMALNEELMSAATEMEAFEVTYNEALENFTVADSAYQNVEAEITKLSDYIEEEIESDADGAVTTYSEGILDRAEAVREAASNIGNTVVDSLEIGNSTREAGVNAAKGFVLGMSSQIKNVKSAAGDIANSAKETMQKLLDIHSPSRVMFKLGDYTMQGFQNGMENLYQPILDSAKAFSYDVEVAHAPDINDFYGGYGYSENTYEPQNNFGGSEMSGMMERAVYNATYNAVSSAIGNSKTLGDIKDLIKEGRVIEIDGREVSEVVRQYANNYTMAQGKPYFAY